MLNYAAKFLRRSWQEAGNVFKSENRNLKGIAKSDKTSAFCRGVDIEASREMSRLVRNNADGFAIHPGKSGHDITREVLGYFKKISIIDNAADHFGDVVGFVGFAWDKS